MTQAGALRRWGPRVAGAAVLTALVVYANASGLLQETLARLERLEAAGPLGGLVFVGLYAATCVLLVPSFVFSFGAGVLFGLPQGLALSLVGAGLGAVLAFWIGRHLAREPVSRAFAGNQTFQALARAVDLRGWRIVALARLSPIFPFSVGNYAFGLTRMPASHYFGASVLGTVPSTTVYVYSGTLAGQLGGADGRARTPAEWALLALGLVATVALTVYLRRVAERVLEDAGTAAGRGQRN